MNLTRKLQVSHLALALVPLVIVQLVVLLKVGRAFDDLGQAAVVDGVELLADDAGDALSESARERLLAVTDLKAVTLDDYFERTTEQLRALSAHPTVVSASVSMKMTFANEGGVDGGKLRGLGNYEFESPGGYRAVHDQVQPIMDGLRELYGYYDIFLLDPEDGGLFYTVFKEDDFARRVTDPVIGGGFEAVWNKAKAGEIAISDMQRYGPSAGAPAIFGAAPVFSRRGNIIAVVAVQLNADHFNAVINDRSGLGQTGNTYAVGIDADGTTSLRCDRQFPESKAAVMGTPKDDQFIRAALSGRSGVEAKVGSTGERELVVYRPFDFYGNRWALVTTFAESEALARGIAIRDKGAAVAARIATTQDETISSTTTTLLIVAGVIGLAGFIIAVAVARSIGRPMAKATTVAEAVADGDLQQRFAEQRSDEIGELGRAIDRMAETLAKRAGIASRIADGDLRDEVEVSSGTDEFGVALRNMSDGLNHNVAGVRQVSGRVASGSSQIAETSQALSQGATQQAASLEEIASAVTEITTQTEDNARNAQNAADLGGRVRDDASRGGDDMKHMVAAMGEIKDASEEISAIIKVIDDIAFQTNLLALNAAVEAARAGRHGKGFAVVADEVRSLAGRSAKAAQQTAQLIEGTNGRVRHGVEIAEQTEHSLDAILEGIVGVTDLVREIAAACAEQADGLGQVNRGIEQVDSATQQAAASAEETAAASADLSVQAKELEALVGRFQLQHQHEVSTQAGFAPVSSVAPQIAATAAAAESQPLPQRVIEITSDQNVELDDNEFGRY